MGRPRTPGLYYLNAGAKHQVDTGRTKNQKFLALIYSAKTLRALRFQATPEYQAIRPGNLGDKGIAFRRKILQVAP